MQSQIFQLFCSHSAHDDPRDPATFYVSSPCVERFTE